MKNIIVIAMLVAIAFYFMASGTFKKEIEFNGDTYHYVKKISGGEVINYFYTPTGTDLKSAEKFIEIIVIDTIPKARWPSLLARIFSRYGLTAKKDEPLVLTGSTQNHGVYYLAYASYILLEEQQCMIFFIQGFVEKPKPPSVSSNNDILEKLQKIQFE